MKAKPRQITLGLTDLLPTKESPLTIKYHAAFPVADLPDTEPGKVPSSDFVESVRSVGRVIVPLVLINQGGKLVIKDGLRRRATAKLLELETVPVNEIVLDGVRGSTLGILLNTARSENPIAELKMILELKKAGADDKVICEATRMPIARLHRRLRLQGLLKELRERAFRGEINTNVAERLARMSNTEQTRALRVLRKSGRLLATDVSGIRRAAAVKVAKALPAALFASQPGEGAPVDWRAKVTRLLADASAACADGKEEAAAIKSAIDEIATELGG